ncbi:hypothetical protein G9X67_14750 [Rhizobium sp. WYCCWR 11152]|uniref:hypothetical protein n=1 Tax=Rhizobium sp. WYCCWR 11152 TaxID=2692316 RepID=UPI0014909C5B|nr:hypothetical protein [Rhizobium sp. WYCCWR 11152]NNU66535.1 hypothetical protein [Rhizobium sp. WYCCWR 11152]
MVGNYARVCLYLGVVGLSGCTTPNEVAKPTDITLEKAIFDVADSLNHLQLRTANRAKVGLIVDEATVTFNVAATADNAATGGATLEALPVSAGGKAGLSISNTLTNNATRGNTITVTFKNMATADYSKGGFDLVTWCKKQPEPKPLICKPHMTTVPGG